jgi:hypothetical protein
MLKRNYTNAFDLKPPNAGKNDEETDEDCYISENEEEEEGTVKIPGRTTTHKFSLVPNLVEGSQWEAQGAAANLEFPGVELLVTIRPTGFGVVSASVVVTSTGVKWEDTGGKTHLISVKVVKGYELARAQTRWTITADMWGTKKGGEVVLLHTFNLTDGDSLLSPLENSQVNKYFTATPQDLEANDNSTRFRFTFSVTMELTEAAWASLKPKESP